MEETARKDSRRVTPSGSGNHGSTQSNVINQYDVLGIIFRYLNARDLARATMVCRLWLEAANYEKRSRGPCHCIINRDKMDDLICYIKNLRINPSIGFFFLPDDISRDVEYLMYDLLPKHCEVIILYCPRTVIVVDEEMRLKVVEAIKLFPVEDALENLKFIYEQFGLLNIDFRSLPNIVCAFLPQIPNMRIKTYNSFKLISKDSGKINEIVNFLTSMSNHKITKTYIMLFCKLSGNKTAKDLAKVLNENSQKNKITSICGSHARDICASYITSSNVRRIMLRGNSPDGPANGTRILSIVPHVRRKEYPNFTAVVLTGSIQMWSISFDMSIPFRDINEQIEVRLNLFKEKVVLKRHSIGFMFTSPRIEIYEQAIVEQEIFKKLFPKVPLVVCYNYDQFSEEIEAEADEEDKDKCGEYNIEYAVVATRVCTLFTILTYC